jgi:hypothetical protein
VRRVLFDAVAVIVGVVIATLFGSLLGIDPTWAVVLAVALGLAPGEGRGGRILAFAIGAGAGWLVTALQAGFLPATDTAAMISWLVGAIIVIVVAAATTNRVPVWAGAAGIATFMGVYGPAFEANPTAFLSESPPALATTLLAGGIGFLLAYLVDMGMEPSEITVPVRDTEVPA